MQPAVDSASRVSPARAWCSVFIMMVAYLFSMLDRTILFLMAEPLQRDLQVSDTQLGLLYGFPFVVFYALAGLPIGRLADVMSRRRIIALGIVLWSVMTAMSGLAQRYWHLFVARMGVGVGEAALNPAAYSLMADMFPRHRLARAIGVFSCGALLGSGLAFYFGGMVLEWVGSRPSIELPLVGVVRSWQVAFFAVGLPGLLVAALMYCVPEPPRPGEPHARALPISALIHFMRDVRWPFLAFIGGFGGQTLSSYATMSWLPTLLVRKHQLATSDVGAVMGIVVGVFGFAGFLAGGFLADHFVRKGHADGHLRVGIIAALLFFPFGIAAMLSASLIPTVACACMVMFALSLATAGGMAALQLMTPYRLRAQVSAIFMLVVNLIGMGLGSFIVGFLNDHVFGSKSAVDRSLIVVYCIALPLMAISFWMGKRPVAALIRRQENSNL
jgi:MFS family permease